MSSYSYIFFGKDTKDFLYMSDVMLSDSGLKELNHDNFHKKIYDYNNMVDLLNPNYFDTFFDENELKFKSYVYKLYKKNDQYVFEDCIQDFLNTRYDNVLDRFQKPIFILRDNKWYYCCEDTGMLLVPCE